MRVYLEQGQCTILSRRKLWLPSLIFIAAEGREEEEVCTEGGSDGQKEGEGREWGNALTPNQTWPVE